MPILMLVIVFLLLVVEGYTNYCFCGIVLLAMIGLALLSPFLGFVLLVVAVLAISWVIILLRKKIHANGKYENHYRTRSD